MWIPNFTGYSTLTAYKFLPLFVQVIINHYYCVGKHRWFSIFQWQLLNLKLDKTSTYYSFLLLLLLGDNKSSPKLFAGTKQIEEMKTINRFGDGRIPADIQTRQQISTSACRLVGYLCLDWISGDIRPFSYRLNDNYYRNRILEYLKMNSIYSVFISTSSFRQKIFTQTICCCWTDGWNEKEWYYSLSVKYEFAFCLQYSLWKINV